MAKVTYKDAGVDLDVYRQSMAKLPKLLGRTSSPRVIPLDGGFAGLFRLDFANRLFARKYEDPVLVSCSDGVGTKLKVACAVGNHKTVGIDLVAMSVNDALCCGAEPLFFLDYVAMPKDDPALLEDLVQGVSDGCIQADCALLGGETAILPDLYAPGDYDLAGFCVGVASRSQIIDGAAVTPGDVVLGLASSGLHSNGYSLARKIAFDLGGHKAADRVEELGTTVGEALLAPTRIYVKPVRQILTYYRVKKPVHAIAHITGGGLHENLARVIPPGVQIVIERAPLAGAAGLRLAPTVGRRRAGRNGPGLQHGHRHGVGGEQFLCREHPRSACACRRRDLSDRPCRIRPARRRLGGSLIWSVGTWSQEPEHKCRDQEQ